MTSEITSYSRPYQLRTLNVQMVVIAEKELTIRIHPTSLLVTKQIIQTNQHEIWITKLRSFKGEHIRIPCLSIHIFEIRTMGAARQRMRELAALRVKPKFRRIVCQDDLLTLGFEKLKRCL